MLASEGGIHEARWIVYEIKLLVLKWEIIIMDFVINIPRFFQQFDSIWFIVDWMTKYAHFLSVRTNFSFEDYAKLFIEKIIKLHGALVSIIFY